MQNLGQELFNAPCGNAARAAQTERDYDGCDFFALSSWPSEPWAR
jgi:hypothetical protein